MPVTIRWDAHHANIIYQEFSGDITPHDYVEMLHETGKLLINVSQVTHVIYDRRGITSLPVQFSRLMQIADKYAPPNLGVIVIVGAVHSTYVVFQLLSVISPKLGKRVKFADSLEHAYQLIAETDQNTQARA